MNVNDFIQQFTVNTAVQSTGDGEADVVRVSVIGTLLDDASLDIIAKEAAAHFNMCDTEDVDLVAIPGGYTNLQELVERKDGDTSSLISIHFYQVRYDY